MCLQQEQAHNLWGFGAGKSAFLIQRMLGLGCQPPSYQFHLEPITQTPGAFPRFLFQVPSDLLPAVEP